MDDFYRKFRDDHHNFDKGKMEDHVPNNPIDFFKKWMEEAVEKQEKEANAMVLSSVDEQNRPSSRILYLKEVTDDNSFVFFTNYNSHKGKDLALNPHASLLFYWKSLERQIRIEGLISKTSEEISDNYFASRPRESQLGAWASLQSEELNSRSELERRLSEFNTKFPEIVPRPPHWGGYQLKPSEIEFWQGRPSRLHDRILYIKHDKYWKIKRLNP